MTIKRIYPTGKIGVIQVRTTEGSYCIAPLTPQGNPTDISNEPAKVKTACLKAWTDEVKEAYQAHKEATV